MAGYVAACSAVGRLSSADYGLDHPDGILDVIPGTGTDPHFNPTKIFYLKEVKGSKSSPAAGLDSTMLCTDSQSQPYSSKKANYDRVADAAYKPVQLARAALTGLTVPDTLITNSTSRPRRSPLRFVVRHWPYTRRRRLTANP